MKLSKPQIAIMNEMSHRAVIGEFSGKFDSRFELFSFRHKTVTTIRRATFFALLESGCIEEGDKSIIEPGVQTGLMQPYSRDRWYKAKAKALRELFTNKSLKG